MWLLSLLVEQCIRLFAGDGALEGELCALHIRVGGAALYALAGSALGRLSTGKINRLCPLRRAREQYDLVIRNAQHSAAYRGKVVRTLGNVLNNAFLECAYHRRMICQYAYIAV